MDGRNLWLFLGGLVSLVVVGLLLPAGHPVRPYLTVFTIAPWAISVWKLPRRIPPDTSPGSQQAERAGWPVDFDVSSDEVSVDASTAKGLVFRDDCLRATGQAPVSGVCGTSPHSSSQAWRSN